MPPNLPKGLPRVVLSSVIRSAHQGESHGGVYLVDLSSGSAEQMLDWNEADIDWEGRGGDRGLRGIAFHRDRLFLAASDEIFVFDSGFARLGSFRNRYLKHCHEIFVAGDSLWATSTGFDSVLEYDLRAERWVRGITVRFGDLWKARRKLNIRPRPRFALFDPQGGGGPAPADTGHVNNVFVDGGTIYVSGVMLGNVFAVDGVRLSRYAAVPYGSHNARPFRGGVLMNHTATDRIVYVNRRGRVLRSFPLRTYSEKEIVDAGLPADHARQAFGRGLAILSDGVFAGGSSPATVSLYRFESGEMLSSVNVSMDIRNAVHGLEAWPFD